MASLPPADLCEADTVYAAMQPNGAYGYYDGDTVAVIGNQGREQFASAAYRSILAEQAVPYSHAKPSRCNGSPFMVGALARLAVSGDKLIGPAVRAVSELGLGLPSRNPMDNNKAQAVELILDVEQALLAVERLLDGDLSKVAPVTVRPRAALGVAVTEAPRGLLIHSYEYDAKGRVVAADVVTPTAMNAASMENHIRWAVEQSPDKDVPTLTKKLEMIARAYDPCISCSVHLVGGRHVD
jgi:sulfhydrogenase subunit alpha